jgi:hypothetical protein
MGVRQPTPCAHDRTHWYTDVRVSGAAPGRGGESELRDSGGAAAKGRAPLLLLGEFLVHSRGSFYSLKLLGLLVERLQLVGVILLAREFQINTVTAADLTRVYRGWRASFLL